MFNVIELGQLKMSKQAHENYANCSDVVYTDGLTYIIADRNIGRNVKSHMIHKHAICELQTIEDVINYFDCEN
jgi:hypothetical protein